MAIPQSDSILHHLRQIVLHCDGARQTDGQLLRSFVQQGDEGAFAALVRRHGPMVRGVCRRVLRNSHDADDAFQATFLVLVRKASALASREVVGDWLHGVAYRTSLKARAAEARRRVRMRQAPRRPAALEVEDQAQWRALLDQEVSRLPEKYRLAVVLCDLQGRTRKEAAQQLGWPEGTVSGRLSRGRALLARRLTRQGLTLDGGVGALALTCKTALALPSALVHSTCRSAKAVRVGLPPVSVPPSVAALTEGVVTAMFFSRLKSIALLLSAASLLIIGVWRYAAAGEDSDKPVLPSADRVPVDAPQHPPALRPPLAFQVDLSIARHKEGKRTVLGQPKLLTPEGKPASFSSGKEYSIPTGDGKNEELVLGPTVRVVICSDGEGFRLDMTVSQPTESVFADGDVTIQTRSIRRIRKVRLGEMVTARLRTNDRTGTVLEVTASIQAARVQIDEDGMTISAHQDKEGEKTIAMAEKDLATAEFMRRSDHLASARFYYTLLRQRYPNTIYAQRARDRLAELDRQPPGRPGSN
jgi:RNA polymerase sigma factor (sigma-70 family)